MKKWILVLAALLVGVIIGVFSTRFLILDANAPKSKGRMIIAITPDTSFKPTIPLEIYAAEVAPADGLVEDATPGASSHKFWRSVSPVIANKDISAVEVIEVRDGMYHLRILLSDEGGEKFGKLSSDRLNKPIAIYVNKKLWSLPIIREPMFKTLFFGGDFHNEEEARVIVHGFVGPIDKDATPILDKVFLGIGGQQK